MRQPVLRQGWKGAAEKEERAEDVGEEVARRCPHLKSLAPEKGSAWLARAWHFAAPRADLARFKVRRFAAPRAGLARFEAFEGFEGFEAFEAFEGSIWQFRASRKIEKESLGVPQPLGLALEKGPLRLPQLPVRLTPRAGLARFKVHRFAAPKDGLARFEAFEGFEVFEAFEGSIRQFRASKRKPWRATAAGFGTRKGTTSLATASSSAYSKSRFGTVQGPSFRSSKRQFGPFRGV